MICQQQELRHKTFKINSLQKYFTLNFFWSFFILA